jgi:hypothetical protein
VIPVVDLSFDEEEIFPDIMWAEEIARRLFGELNHELLGLPGDGNVIILSDSAEEEEEHEEITADTEAAPPSTKNSPAPSISTVETDEVQDDSSDGGDKTGSP